MGNLESVFVDHAMHFWSRGAGKGLATQVTQWVDQLAPPPAATSAVQQAVSHSLSHPDRVEFCIWTGGSKQGPPSVTLELKPAFVDLEKGWTVLGANEDRGFSGSSFWALDPAGRRVMIKFQDLPEAAANERVAYALGKALRLPVNEVQLGIWQGKLVSLHYDVALPGQAAQPLLDLASEEQASLQHDGRLTRIDLFDRLIQNADRNPRNVLVTRPTPGFPDRLQLHLIDHSNSFGVGAFHGLSLYATKLRIHALAAVHFSPWYEARSFRNYLAGLSPDQWRQARTVLRRFGALNDAQLEQLLGEVRELLPVSQYQRMRRSLLLKRDVARELATRPPPAPPVASANPNPGAALNGMSRGQQQDRATTGGRQA